MFKIYDGREHFYQWDLDRKLIVEDPSIKEVHFCNRTDDCSLVCETYVEDGVTLVNVPNILLQTDWKIHVYAYDGSYTKHDECYEVKSRTKPSDYAYTETEILNWSKIDEKITAAIGEANQATANAIEATQNANEVIVRAEDATEVADAAAIRATNAAEEAYEAKANTEEVTATATEAIFLVLDIADNAEAAATLATNAATKANNAADSVNDAIKNAEEATDAAATAASTAVKATDASMKTTEDAITATTGANEAAASANSAADNANSAAASANEAANGINDKFANALKGNKSGEVIAITDISPIEHNLGVKVSSKNLLNPKAELIAIPNNYYLGVDISDLVKTYGSNSVYMSMKLKEGKTIPTGISFGFGWLGSNNAVSAIWFLQGGKLLCNSNACRCAASATDICVFIYPAKQESWDAVMDAFDVQLEIGTTATPYIPYVDVSAITLKRYGVDETDNLQEYAINADGTVEGVTSIYPSTTLLTDTPNVLVNCEYNRDITKAFAELQNAIISLGGNV